MKVLWLRPVTGDNVSVRRERIAEQLKKMDLEVTVQDASGFNAFSAIKEVFSCDYDVIIGNVRIGLYLGYVLAVALRKPLIGDVSDSLEDIKNLPDPIYIIVQALEWWILSRSEACFFVETDSYESAQNRGLEPILARNSVDYDQFRHPSKESTSEAQKILEENGVSPNKPIAIYIGSMVPHYNLSEVGEAAKMTSEWEFVFIGEERGAGIEDIISDSENAYFLGSYDYELMPGFLHRSSAAFCLVDKEQPLKVMEYGAAGLPTLGYDGKLRKNFSEEELVFVSTDPMEISEALRELSSDSDLAEMYGTNLQKRAKENSWKSVAEKYYEQIVKASEQ